MTQNTIPKTKNHYFLQGSKSLVFALGIKIQFFIQDAP